MRVTFSLDDSRVSDGAVEYRWDVDTDILTAQLSRVATAAGMTGSVEIEGSDGSWIIFDVQNGWIDSIEVAVWPDVKTTASLTPPIAVDDAVLTIPARASQPGIAALEVETRITAEADSAERTVHFRVGASRPSRAVRVARDILLELDDARQLAGIWMLNVPPFPGAS